MKRKNLESKVGIAGCYLKRESALPSPWINAKTGVVETLAQHNEIKEPLAKKIVKRVNAE